ncbi:hypothetical protein QQP08_005679 [Theobroma cacao]|nr:hypothetical protein QQP08_005679 [Theobroma cacao]
MDKSYLSLVLLAVLIFASHWEMGAEARGPIISFKCNKTSDCGSVCSKCPACKCIDHFCTCPTTEHLPPSAVKGTNSYN